MLKKGRKVEAACELDVVELWKGGRWKAEGEEAEGAARFYRGMEEGSMEQVEACCASSGAEVSIVQESAWRVRKLTKMR